MGQRQKPLQPDPLGAPKLGDPHPAVGPAEDRGNSDDDHLVEDVPPLERTAGVLKRLEVADERTVRSY
jgi:hypothetical protein